MGSYKRRRGYILAHTQSKKPQKTSDNNDKSNLKEEEDNQKNVGGLGGSKKMEEVISVDHDL